MNRLKILLSWLLLAGGSYFLYNGAHEYFESRYSQQRAANSWNAGREAADVDGRIVEPGPHTRSSIPAGAAFAKLSIPRLHAVVYVVEGTDHDDLRRGPGHLEGTAFPGAYGNCVIAGHRDTHFRVLKDIHKGDEIDLETSNGNFTYRVDEISVVSPDNTSSLQPTSEPVLNLITCYPFWYVGSAPKRFVVRAGIVLSRAARSNPSPAS
jgi:LPXTG-site transpeptidase (sortase) family protein